MSKLNPRPKFETRRYLVRGVLALSLSSLISCQTPGPAPEDELTKAKSFFSPLEKFEAVSCEIKIHLPETFKSKKRAQIAPAEAEEWNQLFEQIEKRNFSWHVSKRNCWVRGFASIRNEVANSSVKEKFVDNLEAQMRLSNCLLLQTFYYQSPLAGAGQEQYQISNEQTGLLTLASRMNSHATIRWSNTSKSLVSTSRGGEQYVAYYEQDLKPQLVRAEVRNKGRSIQVEDIAYKALPSGAKLISDYQLSLSSETEKGSAQAKVSFHQCVARVQQNRPQENPDISQQ